MLAYHLAPHHLASVWDSIHAKIATIPAAFIFSGARLFFTAKNVKLTYKSHAQRPTLLQTIESFIKHLENVVDIDRIKLDKLWINISKETCGLPSFM